VFIALVMGGRGQRLRISLTGGISHRGSFATEDIELNLFWAKGDKKKYKYHYGVGICMVLCSCCIGVITLAVRDGEDGSIVIPRYLTQLPRYLTSGHHNYHQNLVAIYTHKFLQL